MKQFAPATTIAVMALVLAGCALVRHQQQPMKPVDLRCENLVDPLGIDVRQPRLSWRMTADHRGAAQSAYQILCAMDPGRLAPGQADLWDSGKVSSTASRLVPYQGADLKRGVRCYWTVRTWDEKGNVSAWSAPALWTYFDLATDADWQGQWIRGAVTPDRHVAPWLRKTFALSTTPQRAYLYVNALGYFQLFINGRRVGTDEFAPHVSQLNRRTLCLTYDVTEFLQPGSNVIGVWLGDGWAGSAFTARAAGTDQPLLRAQLEMVGPDETVTSLGTDASWRTAPSNLERLGKWSWNRFGGERLDATRAQADWHTVAFDDRDWPAATVVADANAGAVVSAEMLEPNRVIETLRPVSVERLDSGDWLVDLGKAMTGTYTITFPPAPRGHKVTLLFGDEYHDGKLNHFNQVSEYIFRGEGEEKFQNRFNYVSGRYLLVRGMAGGELTEEDVRGYLITTALRRASGFDCSNETLNRIYRMMERTLRCLMLGGYQVDCHSRERMGYGGDGQASLDTTLYLLRSDAFYRKWTLDWVDTQDPASGGLPYVAPRQRCGGGPFWCGFLTAATLKHYRHYGDRALVERNYPAIRKWFELVERTTVDHQQQKFCGGWYLGDWASPAGIADRDADTVELFVNCYMAHVLEQGAQLAEVLGETGDAQAWRASAAARRTATHERFYKPDSATYGAGNQADLVMPLACGVVPPELQNKVWTAFERNLLETSRGHLGTGLSGTYMMIRYLLEIGRDDLVYTFASKTTQPSWGYMIESGATATWEHWNGKASRIHNCFNSIGSWFIEGLGGIRPDPQRPGFQHAIIKPAFVEELTHVNASHETGYGTIRSHWQRDGDRLNLAVVVPPNSTATVILPVVSPERVTESGHPLAAAEGVTEVGAQAGQTIIQLVAGAYSFGWDTK